MADWYYIGHYGQLGPLTREQVDELIEGGVISRDTYVWRSGLAQWQFAEGVTELGETFRLADPYMSPPPPPMPVMAPPTLQGGTYQASYTNPNWTPAPSGSRALSLRSDKNRILAGLLNFIPPGGIGRMYLGYAAYGVLQLVLGLASCGVLYLWSVIDGIVILVGGLKYDGYGRAIED